MAGSTISDLVWRAEPLPWRYGSNITLNVRGTNKMALEFVMDYEVKGHPERLIPYIEKLMKRCNV